jgi:hypothetical protein
MSMVMALPAMTTGNLQVQRTEQKGAGEGEDMGKNKTSFKGGAMARQNTMQEQEELYQQSSMTGMTGSSQGKGVV